MKYAIKPGSLTKALPLSGDYIPVFSVNWLPVGSYDPTDLPTLPFGERLRPGDIGVFPSGEACEVEWASENPLARESAIRANGWE
jgi:hypothetical protein